jgi:2-phospho-L-lactate guanylyltransferase (CobY/MobA/RfbA family)
VYKKHILLGPFSSSLLPLLEAADTFGRVVMAVVVTVVVVNGHGGGVVVVVHRLCGFSLRFHSCS